MPAHTFEAENGFGIRGRLVDLKVPEVEELDLHRVADELASGLNLDDGMIGGHVVEEREVVGLLGGVVEHVG